jgi:Leucine-rich repeat (LRR) protein
MESIFGIWFKIKRENETPYFTNTSQSNKERIRHEILNYLKGNLQQIPDSLFNGVKNLSDIDLSNCEIAELKGNMFNGLKTLSNINFSNNQIKEIPAEFFNGLEEITQINFSNNQIQEIPRNLFYGVKKIDRINFSKNKINKLPEELNSCKNKRSNNSLNCFIFKGWYIHYC